MSNPYVYQMRFICYSLCGLWKCGNPSKCMLYSFRNNLNDRILNQSTTLKNTVQQENLISGILEFFLHKDTDSSKSNSLIVFLDLVLFKFIQGQSNENHNFQLAFRNIRSSFHIFFNFIFFFNNFSLFTQILKGFTFFFFFL